ncbi:MAG TPA: LLM class F420-dependent oxidoreductase [Acidimicrobiia bacterium]|nr:LLM class F420-dependent oxidoreductase [Acidimicrobiia bacterium]
MRIGVVFPQTEIGPERSGVQRYARGVAELGYHHVLAYDHVVGADPAVHHGWDGPYDIHTMFHEPFVLFGHLAAIIDLELVTGIIILPQRQTVLVAKQAAEVDLLTEGKFRCGVGIGWNAVEYEALGKRFSDRGARLEEQVRLLRRLWTETTVTHEHGEERVIGAGLAPMPIQRPIPIWIGGSSEAAYRRMGRLADGWFPQMQPGPKLDAARAIIDAAARDAGRDPAAIGMEGRVMWRGDTADAVARIGQWRDAGATHVSISTMGADLKDVDDHLRVLSEVTAALPGGSP